MAFTWDSRVDIYNIIQYGAPIPMFWNGWKSDTHTLRRHGWTLNAHEDAFRDTREHRIHIAAVDSDKRCAVETMFRVPYNIMFDNYRSVLYEDLAKFGLNQCSMYTKKDIIRALPDSPIINSFNSMQEFDPFIQKGIDKYEDFRVGDFKFFNYEQPKEIYLPYNTEKECLDRLLQLQYPKQEEIRERLKVDTSSEVTNQHKLVLVK